MLRILTAACLLGASTALQSTLSAVSNTLRHSQSNKWRGAGSLRSTDLDDEEAAILAEAEEIAKKKRSNMFNENGVAYAPWMVSQVDEEAIEIARARRAEEKRQARIKLQEAEGVVNILDAATSELSGMGLKAKVIDGEVELLWSTDSEEENKGFIVEKKRLGYSSWDECASYTSWSPLKSKGTLGGAYSYVDSEAEEGEFLYRIIAEQSDNSRQITCQVGITVETSGQQLQTKIVVGFAVALFAGLLYAGNALDPIRG